MSELVLVTGASGYIASHVVYQLLELGYKVRGTVRSVKNEAKVQPVKNLAIGDKKDNLELYEADLMDEQSWAGAVDGCTYVLHMASPFPVTNPKHEDELIKPAVEGTLNVLRACAKSDSIKRVVVTSSCAAVFYGQGSESKVFTEDDWTVLDDAGAYEKSKTLAEKAAWDFMKSSDSPKFELAVMNPTLVIGPVLCGAMTTSMELPKRILMHNDPMLPKLNFPMVDVRDVALAHIKAMTLPDAAGKRHILSTDNLWVSDMAQVLKDEFQPQGYNITTKVAPYPLLWLFGRFDPTIKLILPTIGVVYKVDNSRMTNILGISPIPLKKSLADMGYSLIELGHVRKTAGYKGKTNYLQ